VVPGEAPAAGALGGGGEEAAELVVLIFHGFAGDVVGSCLYSAIVGGGRKAV
jgi:hypothetical protein